VALAALAAALVVLDGSPTLGAPVLLVSIDGLMPEAYLEPDRLGLSVPNLRALVREGAWARGARSVVPSITFPAHTSMITGMNPSRHGVLSNEVFDPDGQLGGGWNWYASDVKVPTLFDRTRAAGLKSAAVTWPATAGAPIDFNLPDMYPVANLREARNLLGLARVGAGADVLAEVLPAPASLVRLRDETRVPVAVRFLKERPDFIAVHFLELDDAQHAFGPRAPQVLIGSSDLRFHRNYRRANRVPLRWGCCLSPSTRQSVWGSNLQPCDGASELADLERLVEHRQCSQAGSFSMDLWVPKGGHQDEIQLSSLRAECTDHAEAVGPWQAQVRDEQEPKGGLRAVKVRAGQVGHEIPPVTSFDHVETIFAQNLSYLLAKVLVILGQKDGQRASATHLHDTTRCSRFLGSCISIPSCMPHAAR
jgi:hypothetical protein